MFVTNLLLIRNIFVPTNRFSIYAQSPGTYFIQAITTLYNCTKSLSDKGEDHVANKLLDDTGQFAEDND